MTTRQDSDGGGGRTRHACMVTERPRRDKRDSGDSWEAPPFPAGSRTGGAEGGRANDGGGAPEPPVRGWKPHLRKEKRSGSGPGCGGVFENAGEMSGARRAVQ